MFWTIAPASMRASAMVRMDVADNARLVGHAEHGNLGQVAGGLFQFCVPSSAALGGV
jgi:hypothetical protein